MAFTKKQQIRGVRILLTVFYGFLLSSILFRYIIHGIIDTIRSPNPWSILMMLLGVVILISIALAIYATWFDNTTIMLVSGGVLIFIFILTIVFGVVRIVNTASVHGGIAKSTVDDRMHHDDLSEAAQRKLGHKVVHKTDSYTLVQDATELVIELIAILFAILGTFILYRYVQSKYASVPTSEAKDEAKDETKADT